MAPLALLSGVLATAAIALPGAGKYLALGLGLFAVAAGALAYRASPGRARPRLTAAAAITLGLVAALLAGTKVALTLAAAARLEQLF